MDLIRELKKDNKHMENKAYRILRFFSDGRSPRRIKLLPTLELARLHCNSPLTRGTLRSGVSWFEGFKEIRKRG
jgi:hypothetical protein